MNINEFCVDLTADIGECQLYGDEPASEGGHVMNINEFCVDLTADIDECQLYGDEPASGGGRGCDHICTNILMSFNCSCRSGYSLYIDDKRCLGMLLSMGDQKWTTTFSVI